MSTTPDTTPETPKTPETASPDAVRDAESVQAMGGPLRPSLHMRLRETLAEHADEIAAMAPAPTEVLFPDIPAFDGGKKPSR